MNGNALLNTYKSARDSIMPALPETKHKGLGRLKQGLASGNAAHADDRSRQYGLPWKIAVALVSRMSGGALKSTARLQNPAIHLIFRAAQSLA